MPGVVPPAADTGLAVRRSDRSKPPTPDGAEVACVEKSPELPLDPDSLSCLLLSFFD